MKRFILTALLVLSRFTYGQATLNNQPAVIGGALAPATTATPYSSGTGTSPLATQADVQNFVPQLTPGYQVLYTPWVEGSGTTLVDHGPNGYTGTFASSGNAPSFTTDGSGILFQGNQNISIPSGALNGAQTILLLVSLTNPGLTDTVNSGLQSEILSDSNGIGIASYGSSQGSIMVASGTAIVWRAPNVAVGNSCSVMTVNGANVQQYLNGKTLVEGLNYAGTITFTGSSAGMIGDLTTYTNHSAGFNGIFYGMAVWPSILTAAQVQSSCAALENQVQVAKGIQFPALTQTPSVLFDGDSIFANLGNSNALTTSIPYLAAQQANIGQFWNIAVSGRSSQNVYSNLSISTYPLWDGNNNLAPRLDINNAGTNDINAGTTGATTYTSDQNWCAAILARYPGSLPIISTIIDRSTFNSTKVAQKVALNSAIISGARAGTTGCGGVIDVGVDPIASTQTVPNAYNTGGASSYNATYFSDGTHPKAVLNAILAPRVAVGILYAQKRLTTPFWVPIQIPYVVLNTFANTSQVLPMFNLLPGEQLCGAKEQVTTAFSGTSITALTVQLGDSTGTATQYLPSLSMLATGSQMIQSNTYVSSNGTVNATFASTGANMSALTAGAMTIDVCIISTP